MDNLTKTIIGLFILLIIVVAVGFVIQTINGTGKTITNSTASQKAYVSNEIKAMENSSIPITINPSNALVFGSWKNTSQRICGQQQAVFYDNFFNLSVLKNGYYFPIYVYLKALGNYAPNLTGQKVYLDFIANNNKNISAPYIVRSEIIKNNIEFWNFTFDESTNNAINSMLNPESANITTAQLNGVILLNGTPIISPVNPALHNNFTATNC